MICSSGLKILLIRTADNHHNYTMRAQKEQAKSTDKRITFRTVTWYMVCWETTQEMERFRISLVEVIRIGWK